MKTFLTTTIPYVNASPHVGFALELIQADFVARYRRLKGHAVRFQTGTDENSLKNVLAAKAHNLTTTEWVDKCSKEFFDLAAALNISHDDFVRTTEIRHKLSVQAFINKLAEGDVYKKNYSGLYCVGCEDFIRETDLVDGKCADHKTIPEVVTEENYFFRLSRYQSQIEALLSSGKIEIYPASRKAEILAFISEGLQDISISRNATRSGGWGIPFPADPSHILYVWIDALINYVTGPGLFGSDTNPGWWSDKTDIVHALGKNVWKFHAIYWPAMLLSAELPLPHKLLVHGFLTVDGEKISKTQSNAVSPLPLMQKFGVDSLRYHLLKCYPIGSDGDFSEGALMQSYRQYLSNGIGNLLSRLTKLAENCSIELDFDEYPPAPEDFDRYATSFDFYKALEALDNLVLEINREIEVQRPWEARKRK